MTRLGWIVNSQGKETLECYIHGLHDRWHIVEKSVDDDQILFRFFRGSDHCDGWLLIVTVAVEHVLTFLQEFVEFHYRL